MPTDDKQSPTPDSTPRLGYLVKHAHLAYLRLTADALEPIGIDPRDWAALNCLGSQPGRSQREVAHLLGVDRTTMVEIVDHLERRGWVTRRPHPEDRRKNTAVLTARGRTMLRRGTKVIDECEERFLAALGRGEADRLRAALHAVIRSATP